MISAALALLTLAGYGDCLDPFLNKAKPFSQEFEDNFNILKYTGWEGPYSQRRGVGLNRDTPAGCRVDQVTMLHRHGERYPSTGSAKAQAAVYESMTSNRTEKFVGSLEFLNYWVPYADGNTAMDQTETEWGAYAGLFGAYSNGVDYRRRYGHLYDSETVLPLFSSGYERIVSTARKFGQGFLGFNYTDMAALQIIPEVDEQGGNTLVAGDCPAGITNITSCPVPSLEYQKSYTNGWYLPEFTKAAKRLNKENNLNLTGTDVHNLMSTGAFEINIRGNSPWISVFTDDEWVAFEYYESAYYYCYFGPGAEASKYRGSVYLNATRTLLNQGPEEVLPLYFSFAHDTDITPVVSLLGFATDNNLDPSQVTFGNLWDVTDVVPQNAHLVFERLVCDSELSEEELYESRLASQFPLAFNATNGTATYAANFTYPAGSNISVAPVFGNISANDTHYGHANTEHKLGTENVYVRVILNDAVAPLPGCSSGPGKSCKLSEFSKFVDKAIDGNDYYENCVKPVNPDWDAHVKFFWDWNVTNAYDWDPLSIPYQAALVDYQGNAI